MKNSSIGRRDSRSNSALQFVQTLAVLDERRNRNKLRGYDPWAKRIQVNEQDFITRPTAEQIVAHNRKVAAFCR